MSCGPQRTRDRSAHVDRRLPGPGPERFRHELEAVGVEVPDATAHVAHRVTDLQRAGPHVFLGFDGELGVTRHHVACARKHGDGLRDAAGGTVEDAEFAGKG